MKRILLTLAAVFLAGTVQAASPEQLNVLFIAVDDLNNDLGCYGHPVVKTPNIDRLARMGTRFDRAYSQFPLCNPTRASAMTGLRPDTIRVFDLATHFRKAIPDVITLPQLFAKNGYFAARVGKIYHQHVPNDVGKDGLDDPPSWAVAINPTGRDKVEEGMMVKLAERGVRGNPLGYLIADGTDKEQTDGMVAAETIKLLEAHKDKPFFIAAGFYRPHLPFIAPKKYFDLYPLESVRVEHGPFDYAKELPPPALASTRPWPWQGLNADQLRELTRAYWACVSFVDAQVGEVLKAVERLGLTQNTIIVFWGDHGFHLGDHGLTRKRSLFENSARSPLIIAAPGMKGKGEACLRTVEFVDLYPTLADLASLTPPRNLAGVSLKPLLNDSGAPWNRPAFTQVWYGFPGHSVRTERFRYTEWDNGKQGAQLYDYDVDPGEKQNLASDPRHAETVARLKALIQENWKTEYRPGRSASPAGEN
jgi:iduronate 2-sulfatase